MQEIKSRSSASLYALAMGDAYGVGFEFMTPEEVIAYYPIRPDHSIGGGHFDFLAGEFSDDTEMAALTVASLQRKKRVDVAHIKTLYILWAYVAKDIGVQTTSALLNSVIDSHGEGNGAFMRILPASAYMFDVLEMSISNIKEEIAKISAITHDNDTTHAINDLFIDLLLEQPLEKHADIIDLIGSTTGNSGWVMNTARIVYQTLQKEKLSLMEGFWKIIKQGGDTDTACAIYVAIRGYREPELVTQELLDKLLSHSSQKQLNDLQSIELNTYVPDPIHLPLLFAGQYPGSSHRISHALKLVHIAELGVDSIINLMEEDELIRFTPYQMAIRGLFPNFTVHSFPIRDMDVPTRMHLEAILDTMDRDINANKKVYVHCWGGHGRTGTLIGSYLVRHGMKPVEALEKIRTQRRLTSFGDQPSPQTQDQIDFVMEARCGSPS